MAWLRWVVVAVSAMVAGAVNSVAGGGTVFNFSGLVWFGLPTVEANATNATSLIPGSFGGAVAMWPELKPQWRTFIILAIPTVLGSLIGARTVVNSPEAVFRRVVPFLVLFATLVFALSNHITRWVRRKAAEQADDRPGFWNYAVGVVVQLVISIYGGYFGAGIGILMLTSLSLMGMTNLLRMNAIKNMLAVTINGTAMIYFIRSGAVVWPVALFAAVFALIGGYGLGRYARRIDQNILRWGVVIAGIVVSIWMFARLYLA
jgi:uncharacterized membrane protein YfcA